MFFGAVVMCGFGYSSVMTIKSAVARNRKLEAEAAELEAAKRQ